MSKKIPPQVIEKAKTIAETMAVSWAANQLPGAGDVRNAVKKGAQKFGEAYIGSQNEKLERYGRRPDNTPAVSKGLGDKGKGI